MCVDALFTRSLMNWWALFTISSYPRTGCPCTHAPCRPDRQVENTRHFYLYVHQFLHTLFITLITLCTDRWWSWLDGSQRWCAKRWKTSTSGKWQWENVSRWKCRTSWFVVPFSMGFPPSSFDRSLTTIQVYLDNHVAVNELLVKELEKEFEGRDHKWSQSDACFIFCFCT